MAVLDSSSLISLSNSCLLKVLDFLARRGASFVVPPEVFRESVERPLALPSRLYSYSADRIHRLFTEGIITVVKAQGERVLQLANSLFYVSGRPLRILHQGEAEALALSADLKDPALCVDERTTISLLENPEGYRQHLEKELGKVVFFNSENYEEFLSLVGPPRVYRSTELVMLAYLHGFFDDWPGKEKVVLDALYHLKYSGCGITFSELKEYERLLLRTRNF